MLKTFWCIILTISLVMDLFDGTVQKNMSVISNITLLMILQNIALVAIVFGAFVGLTKLHRIFDWSWMSDGMNINIMPIKIRYFGLVFALLFMVNLPRFARMEEVWFRSNTTNWQEGIYMSLVFGMVHCLVGVPIGAGIVIALAGLWFTHQYFIGGVDLSTLHHTTYNLIIFSVIFLALLFEHIERVRNRKEQAA